VLRQPDYKRPFFLSTDASAYSVGAVLSQEGELNPRTKKTHATPNCILLGVLLERRKRLRHIRTRIAGNYESSGPVETTPSRHLGTGDDPNGPCQPHLLEGTT